ncbi:MAG: cyclic nucleotide-binding domain-containing protein [Anaerolineales bacterium]|jgi:hypothetical protein|nr:cyclic nucleotide-binding domain-containing protein [Anaerolineales bacterium]
MTDQTDAEIASLKRCAAFRDLSDALVSKVARLSKGIILAEGDRLEVKADPEAPFYMVLEGKVQVDEQNPKNARPPQVLKQGEFFGAHALLHGRSFSMAVVALEPTRLITMDVRTLAALMQQERTLKEGLQEASTMYRRLHSRHFHWVDPEENVQVILHEHPFYLAVGIAQGVFIALMGIMIPVLTMLLGSIGLTTLSTLIGSVVIVIGILWGIWQYIDWDNDYYVVTDRRIAWIEQIIILYDSRNDILLSELRSVEPETDFLGRILGYANLYIKDNFQRVIVFKNIGYHLQIKKAIETLAIDAKIRQQQLDRTALDRKMLGWLLSASQPIAPSAAPSAAPEPGQKVPPFQRVQKYFDFQMHLREGDTIIYRRHVLFLIYRTLPAMLMAAGILLSIPILIYAELSGWFNAPTLLTTLAVGSIMLVGCALWAWYQYEDWRNDTYQITLDKIIARQKKPLDIDRRTELALLAEEQEQVIGLEHRRASFFGVIFNYGEVFLSVKIPGEVQVRKMTQVYDPAQVHQDIFDRIYHKKRKQAQEELKKSDQLKDYFGSYHRVSGLLNNTSNRGKNSTDSEVK